MEEREMPSNREGDEITLEYASAKSQESAPTRGCLQSVAVVLVSLALLFLFFQLN
jgi:hypothetical protein